MSSDELRQLSDNDLLLRLDGLALEDRRLNVCIIEHLAEVEVRRLHLDLGYSSLYAYATERLGFSENMAYKRTRAAGLSREFPALLGHLASGDLTLSSIVVLAPHLDDEDAEALIDEACGMSKREVERLVARKNSPRGESPRVKLELWVSEETLAAFDKARDLDRHIDPGGDGGDLLGRMAVDYIAKREKERFAVTKKPRSQGTRAGDSAKHTAVGISAAAKRDVLQRDGQRCTFVGPDGTRCSSTAFLEIDHRIPRALGGGNHIDNLRLLCRPHNGRAAERLLGADTVQRARLAADASQALVQLGFSRGEARRAVSKSEGATIEAMIRSALRYTPSATLS